MRAGFAGLVRDKATLSEGSAARSEAKYDHGPQTPPRVDRGDRGLKREDGGVAREMRLQFESDQESVDERE